MISDREGCIVLPLTRGAPLRSWLILTSFRTVINCCSGLGSRRVRGRASIERGARYGARAGAIVVLGLLLGGPARGEGWLTETRAGGHHGQRLAIENRRRRR
jgi:hypothetical protein